METKQTAAIVSTNKWDTLEAALRDVAEVSRVPDLESLGHVLAESPPDVVFLDIGEFKESLNGNGSLPGVDAAYFVSVAEEFEPAQMRAAMRAGTRDFLKPPFEPRQFEELFLRAKTYRERTAAGKEQSTVSEDVPAKQAEVITFFTTKGGAGKSTLATNFALAITRSNPDSTVCLVDLDLQFGDLAMIMNIKPRATAADLISREGELSEDVLSYLCEYNDRVSLLAAPLRPEEADLVRAQHIEGIVDKLREHFDYVVIDTAASFHDVSLAALDKSSQVFIVITPLILSLKNLKRVLELMTQSLGYEDEKIKVVLNRCDSKPGIEKREIEKLCGRKIDFQVPSQGQIVVESINQGTPAVETYPRCKFSTAVMRMAEAVASETGKHEAPRGFMQFLARLFGRLQGRR